MLSGIEADKQMLLLVAFLLAVVFVIDVARFNSKIARVRNISNRRKYVVHRNLLLLTVVIATCFAIYLLRGSALFIIGLCACVYLYISYNAYKVLFVANFLNELVCKRKGCEVYLGLFYAVTKVRDFLLFCFFKDKIHMIVWDAEECSRDGSRVRAFLKMYLSGKVLDRVRIGNVEVITIRGKAYVYNPNKRSWCSSRGDISAIRFLDVRYLEGVSV